MRGLTLLFLLLLLSAGCTIPTAKYVWLESGQKLYFFYEGENGKVMSGFIEAPKVAK